MSPARRFGSGTASPLFSPDVQLVEHRLAVAPLLDGPHPESQVDTAVEQLLDLEARGSADVAQDQAPRADDDTGLRVFFNDYVRLDANQPAAGGPLALVELRE